MGDRTPSPVIILAPRESGGSLLAALLGCHPECVGAPHLNLLAFEFYWQQVMYAQVPRDSHLHGLHRFVGDLLMGEQSVQSVAAARRWLERRKDLPTRVIHLELCRLVVPRMLVDYSPLYVLNEDAVRRVVEACPNATFIHILRNPVSHGEAMRRPVWQTVATSQDYWSQRGCYQPCLDMFEISEQYIDWSVTPAVFDPQFAWYRAHTAILRILDDVAAERVIRLPLWRLQKDPTRTIADILGHLGVATEPDLIDRIVLAGLTPYSRSGPYTAPFGTDYEMLETSVIEALNLASRQGRRDLHAPLPWRGDGGRLLPEVVELAESLGL